MRLPKNILIDGKKFRVVRRSLRHRVISKGKITHKPYYGAVNIDKRIITVSWRLTDAEKFQTLVHEVLHAVLPDVEEEAILRAEKAMVETVAALGGKK